jgi:hypothetical protein
MENPIYERLITTLESHFGLGKALASGNGVRFVSARRGKATVYHSMVSAGNRAEIAFEPVSMAKRFGVTEGELRTMIAKWRTQTGRDVSPDAQFNWPRVGLSEAKHVDTLLQDLRQQLESAVGGARS